MTHCYKPEANVAVQPGHAAGYATFRKKQGMTSSEYHTSPWTCYRYRCRGQFTLKNVKHVALGKVSRLAGQ
ncbi:uncharacterized protein SPSK_10379 [Sporothrix schenckii 1099-18]|uniref:Uncharacterized protein n=1 Tax=Sporothrix schenckii 1099-18 TaxID=1397361 RepID=A0A0F2LZB2_SPOSC|nr:uncharacterized protein SPSK_10379 [Sporothrix schenckii 1099-18]KJR81231.1 hypothetical protein SPSK_10379 [Sporothrix schenckii 1099-18]